MERIIPNKRERVIFYGYTFSLMTLLVLIAAKLCLDYFPFGFFLYAGISYLIMAAGALVYKRMYILTHEAIVNAGGDKVLPMFSYAMLTVMMIISITAGVLMFFHKGNVFASIFLPSFFFMGALIWEICISQMLDVLEEKEIKIVIRKSNTE